MPTVLLIALALGQSPSVDANPTQLRGKWILDARGKTTPARGFTRGLQPSGLLYRKGTLWSIGDQRSRYPAHLLRVDPGTARLRGAPIPLEIPTPPTGEFREYDAIPMSNPDFEGLCAHPKEPGTFFAVTEDKTPWIAEIRLQSAKSAGAPASPRASITRLTRVDLPAGVRPWREDTNFRFEGITASDDARVLYLAFERAADDLPRICRVPLKDVRSRNPVTPEVVPLPFEKIPRRADKPRARLNINDIQFLRCEGHACLLAVLRDQERLLLLDLAARGIRGVVDLDLRAPSGDRILWVSPEALAVDAPSGRVWIVNDPDSVRGNYRALDTSPATGRFADYTPLLFEIPLSKVTGAAATDSAPRSP